MPRGDNQRGKARAPKVKKLTKRQERAGDTSSGIFGMKKIRKGGITKWVPKNQ